MTGLNLRGCEDMAQAITNSSGAYVTGNDDGAKHEKRHANEHDWKSFDSPDVENVITLTDNKLTDDTKDLAYQKAFEQGLRTEEEWQEYNAKKRKDRQEDSYIEHVGKSARSLMNALEKQKKKGGKEKAKVFQQLSSIVKNDGLAVHGNLYYISDFTEYEKRKDDPAELSKYREFEIETFRRFQESKTYKKLHPDEIRAEIHTDEMGAIHLQTSEVLGRASKNGQYQITPVACKEEALKSLIPEKAFQDSIVIEQLMKDKTEEEREASGDYIVLSDKDRQRVLASFPKEDVAKIRKALFDQDGNLKKNNPYRSDLVKRAYRRIENRQLEAIAKDVAKEMGVTWERDWGVSDGSHRDKESYIARKKDQEQFDKEAQSIAKKFNELTVKEEKLKEKETALEKHKADVDKRVQRLNEHIAHATALGEIAKTQIDSTYKLIGDFRKDIENMKNIPDVYKPRILQVVDQYENPEEFERIKQQKERERQAELEKQRNRGRSL